MGYFDNMVNYRHKKLSKKPINIFIFKFYRTLHMRTSQRFRVYPENQLESVSSIVESESDDENKQDVEPNTRRIIEVR